MGRTTLIAGLVVGDLRRRPLQAALLLLVIMAATTTLTLGLALAGVTSHPYQQTRAASAGPDVIASYTDLPPMRRADTPSAALAALANPRYERIDQVLLVLTVMLVVLAAVNALSITQATAVDARHSAALARALGATSQQVSRALVTAQLIPAIPGVLLGIPAGIGLVGAVAHGGATTVPSAWWLLAMAASVLAALAVLTALPARIGGRRPPAEILQAESVTG